MRTNPIQPSPAPWALILAGGEGRRLQSLTTLPSGRPVPKQFCSLTGQRTLLEDTIERARGTTRPDRICTIVDERHREFWAGFLHDIRPSNVIVHPWSRGTAIGILHSLLVIDANNEGRDAKIVVLPADHYVRDEPVLRNAIHVALQAVYGGGATPILLGIRPEHADSELGYIIPAGEDAAGCKAVNRFVEKPPAHVADEVVKAGGLWNSFILVASIRQLLHMFMARYAALVLEMQAVLKRARSQLRNNAGWFAVIDLYERLPTLDFSRDVIEDQAERWRVIEVPWCGWSDLGTPARVKETLRRFASTDGAGARQPGRYVNLQLSASAQSGFSEPAADPP